MKANLPKPTRERMNTTQWAYLPQREKDAIHKMLEEHCAEFLEKEVAEVQEIWIKLCCILIKEQFHLDEEQMLQFVVAWSRMYRRNERIPTRREQQAWLAEEMTKCFPTVGFPQARIDRLKAKR